MSKDLYYHIRTISKLTKAWNQVYQNGIRSPSVETQKAVKEFRVDADRRLKKIQRQLYQKKFKFNPAKGVPVSISGKDARPIVVADIKDRIVQRSILDVIQAQNSVSGYVNVPTSFGGLEGKSVRDAIEYVCRATKTGFRYYVTSDPRTHDFNLSFEFLANPTSFDDFRIFLSASNGGMCYALCLIMMMNVTI